LGQFSDAGDRLSQTDDLSPVKARIKALTDKTVANGCTEAEAMSAAGMVGRLLERYALSMDEIEVRSARCVQVEVHLGSRRRRPIDGCVPAIARFCDCKVWLAPAARPDTDDPYKPIAGIRYIFFGFETDAALAAYLFAVIDRAISNEISTFKRYNPRLRAEKLRRASASFQHGLVARVVARLEKMHDEREAAVRAQRAIGTALMVVKQTVVDDAFAETNIRLVTIQAINRPVVTSAYRAGLMAGDRVNLRRPMTREDTGLLN
jgi:hypothetical protein